MFFVISGAMNKEEVDAVKIKWKQLTEALAKQFDEAPDLQVILFLIGVQELGKGKQTFSKDDKQNLMHLATCRILSEFGYYSFEKLDEDGWPHYKVIQKLPPMSVGEQDLMLRKAAIAYFEKKEIL